MTEYLYHYTNLETLKLILQNKTLRLSSLSKMDDLEEGVTSDVQKLCRFIYISSWKKNPTESLALWGYSRGDAGIRIKMKANPFKTENINSDVNIKGSEIEVDEEYNIGLMDLMKTKNIHFLTPRAELIRVTYTDLERLLIPKVYNEFPGGHFSIVTGKLGVFKRIEWKEQQEWRYRLSSLPFSFAERSMLMKTDVREPILNKIRTRDDLGFIDLPLKDDAFEGLEVLCSPNMTRDNIDELNKVIGKYAADTVVKQSRLQIRS